MECEDDRLIYARLGLIGAGSRRTSSGLYHSLRAFFAGSQVISQTGY